MDTLTEIAKETETAKNVFALFQARERFRRETNLGRLHRTLIEDGKKVVDEELVILFKKLEALGIGTLVIGRGNRFSRFKWHYNLKDVAKAAKADKKLPSKAKITDLPPPRSTQRATAMPMQVVMTADQLEALIQRLLKAGGK